MKTRTGHVSNSSSSSFVVDRKAITPWQEYAIIHHTEVAVQLLHWSENASNDPWQISMDDDQIVGFTMMDNFDFESFMKAIGVNVEFEGH